MLEVPSNSSTKPFLLVTLILIPGICHWVWSQYSPSLLVLQKESTGGPLGPPDDNTRAGTGPPTSSVKVLFEFGTQICRLPGQNVIFVAFYLRAMLRKSMDCTCLCSHTSLASKGVPEMIQTNEGRGQ